MKISVCIPVFNFDVHLLVKSLKKEITNAELDAEIILIDDASTKDFVTKNESLKEEVNQFIFLEKNIGRSAIRNLFLNYASGDFLLFLDCDAQIISEKFIKNYIDFLLKNPSAKIIYGGRVLPNFGVNNQNVLRWKYAKERENLPLKERRKNSFLSFQTNNFFIEKQILKSVQFNENFTGYGYEDLVFSLELKNKGFTVFHIENPILNSDVESSETYLLKIEQATYNLAFLYKSNPSFFSLLNIRLIQAFIRLKKLHLDGLYFFFFKIFKRLIKKSLLSKKPSLILLDFYKLGLLIEKQKHI